MSIWAALVFVSSKLHLRLNNTQRQNEIDKSFEPLIYLKNEFNKKELCWKNNILYNHSKF